VRRMGQQRLLLGLCCARNQRAAMAARCRRARDQARAEARQEISNVGPADALPILLLAHAFRETPANHYAAMSTFACAAICAKTFSLQLFDRELRSLSANCSSTPSSKAFTTVSCT
jgi:hypothetical protein